jgi:small-conductance mechanosensitive channel
MLIKTLPRYQWSLKRELNLRIKKAFEQNGIRIPFPQREVRTYINNPEKGELG